MSPLVSFETPPCRRRVYERRFTLPLNKDRVHGPSRVYGSDAMVKLFSHGWRLSPTEPLISDYIEYSDISDIA